MHLENVQNCFSQQNKFGLFCTSFRSVSLGFASGFFHLNCRRFQIHTHRVATTKAQHTLCHLHRKFSTRGVIYTGSSAHVVSPTPKAQHTQCRLHRKLSTHSVIYTESSANVVSPTLKAQHSWCDIHWKFSTHCVPYTEAQHSCHCLYRKLRTCYVAYTGS